MSIRCGPRQPAKEAIYDVRDSDAGSSGPWAYQLCLPVVRAVWIARRLVYDSTKVSYVACDGTFSAGMLIHAWISCFPLNCVLIVTCSKWLST